MAGESFNKGIVIQQLVDSTRDIRSTTLRTQGVELSPIQALGQAMRRVGRSYLLESLRMRGSQNVAGQIEEYLADMPPLQGQQFGIGINLGVLGCTIAAVEDPKLYLPLYNQHIVGTPIASEPTEKYNEAETVLFSRDHIGPDEDAKRIEKLVAGDPTYKKILSGIDTMPLSARIHLLSLHRSVKDHLQYTVLPIYREAFASLNTAPTTPAELTSLKGIIRVGEEDWLAGLLEDLDKPLLPPKS